MIGLILFSFSLFAGEGQFYNDSPEIQYCYNSTAMGCIKREEVPAYGTCIGDAMGNEVIVFKAPDNSYMTCSIEAGCRSTGVQTDLMIRLGIWKKGARHYGAMTMNDFRAIMGNKSFCDEQERLPAVVSTGGEGNSSP